MKSYDVKPLMDRYKQAKIDVPKIIANTCQLIFNNEFNRSQWNGESWIPGKNSKNTKHLLVNTGALRQALNNCVKHAGWDKVIFAVDLDYGQYQNYGTEHIPARPFIGKNQKAITAVRNKLNKRMKAIFK